jgi:hypothetical protein
MGREGWRLKLWHRTVFIKPALPVYIRFMSPRQSARGARKQRLIICWLTGYDAAGLAVVLEAKTDFETFFTKAPAMNPSRALVTGVVCGVRVEDVEEPLMLEIRILDKMVDELARGKKMEKILRA